MRQTPVCSPRIQIHERQQVIEVKIAFFDSGIGGLTVLHEAIKRLPDEDFLYYADTKHVPYGTKTLEEVNRFVKESVAEIMRENIKALVVACNTATSAAIDELRGMYDIPIIGMEPAVKPAVERSLGEGKRVLVFATPLALSLTKYADLVARVDDHSIVDSIPLPELVQYCEQLEFDAGIIGKYFEAKLASVDLSRYGTMVLGCTHYPFYKLILREILPPHIELIDGSRGTVKRLVRMLESSPEQGDGNPRGTQDVRGNQDTGDAQDTCDTQDTRNIQGTRDVSNVRDIRTPESGGKPDILADIHFMCSDHNEHYINKMKLALAFLNR